jgi:MATE family, multidrug efflux pump
MSEKRTSSAAVATGATTATQAWWREVVAMTALALPLVGSQLAVIAMATTDVIMMGWLGPTQLAAGALGSAVYFPIMHLGFGVMAAVAPMVAHAIGAGNFRGVRRSVRQGFWVASLFGAIFAIPLWFAGDILVFLGQQQDLADLAQGYLRAALWGLGPLMWAIVLRGFLTAHERPRAVFFVMVIGIGVNALGNYALMFGNFGFPRLELVGAGISTSVVDIFMALALIAFVLRDRRLSHYQLFARFWRADWPRFVEVVRLGGPIGLAVLAESSLFGAAGILMGLIGRAELAAHAIAMQCAAVAFMIPLGISQAVTARVGLAAGARDRAGVGRAGWVAIGLGIVFTLVSASLFWFAGEWLVGLYLDLDNADNGPVVSLAVSFLVIAALFQLVDGAQAVGAGALRGMRDTRVPMMLAIFGYWGVGLPTSAVLAFPVGLGGQGVWMGLATGLTVVAILLVWRFYRRERLLPALPARA